MPLVSMNALDLDGKRVLIRADFNVPLADGKITSARRIEAALSTVRGAAEAGGRVMVLSHLGRPEEGRFDAAFSLAPVAAFLSRALGREVKLCAGYLDAPPQLDPGEVVLLENVRFNRGEKANDPQLARQYAALCDVFVMDAFATAHRAQASTHGVAQYAPAACAGPLLLAELEALSRALDTPKRPLVAIVGGAKVSGKLAALESLLQQVDQLIPGGGIANTFLNAAGHAVGKSLYEAGRVSAAGRMLRQAEARGRPIPLPDDVVVAPELSAEAPASVKTLDQIGAGDRILDIGPATVARYVRLIENAGSVVWNGPVGAFELPPFGTGTEALGRAIARSSAFSVVGGGDTVAAVERYGLAAHMSCITTGGGAFLAVLEGGKLPAVQVLEARAGGR
ncbi:MAG: phosphoglycerate kinase [Gammaproteobacteria bacterium]|nr:phosphoglycerate kinase [Gammaproteobacteria bacterium]